MIRKDLEGTEVDICPNGHGIWLDEGELYQLSGIDPKIARILICPTCRVMMATKMVEGVEIDICPRCKSIWLDKGELEKLAQIDPMTGQRNDLNKILYTLHDKGELSMTFDLD